MKVPCEYCGNMIEKEPSQVERSEHHYCNKEHSVLDRMDRARALSNAFGD